MVTEAPPDPAPGPQREALAASGAQRVDRAVGLMEAAITAYSERLESVVAARMRGPKARKGTRWWSESKALAAGVPHTHVVRASGPATCETPTDLSHDRVTSGFRRGVDASSAHTSPTGAAIELKSIDADYVLPARVTDELAPAVRPVALRIVADASASVAKSLGRPNTGLAAFDWRALESAVDSVVERLAQVNERHARDIRAAILAADSSDETLDAALARVLEATRRGGRWLLLAGRTLATALAGDAALAAAKAMGVAHTQWLSRRDGRVRHTHVAADGQQRAIGTRFEVGTFRLRHPADPTVLPAGAAEVYGCRCSLLFVRPDPIRDKAAMLAARGTADAARRLLDDAKRLDGPVVLSAPELGAGMSIPAVPLRSDTVGYRVLDAEPAVTPGQRISWPGELALALAPPVAAGAVVLAVALPVGMVVGVAAGAVVVAASTTLAVASVTAGQIVATPIMP